MSNSLQPHELQHATTPCPSPTPGAYTNSSLLSQSRHPTISSSVIPFSSWALVFPNVSNWLHFHPLHCLSSTFPPFLSNCASCDTESLFHRLCTSYPILDWFLSRSAARLAVILGFPSGCLGVPDSWIPRLSLLWVSFIFLHNYTNTPPIVFPCTSTASNFLKSLVRVKAAANVGWGVGVVGLSPASPWPPSHLAPALGLRPADRSSLLWTRSLFLSLYCAPLHSAITSPPSESSNICWRLWSPVAPMLVFISSRGRRGRLWWVGWAHWMGWNPVYQGQDFWPGPNHKTSVLQLPYQ